MQEEGLRTIPGGQVAAAVCRGSFCLSYSLISPPNLIGPGAS